MRKSLSLLFNTSLSFGTNLVAKASSAIIFILVARESGAAQAGVFSLATTYLLLFSALTWGLDELMTRQVARDNSSAVRYFGAYLALRLILTTGLYGVLALVIRIVLGYPPSIAVPVLIIGLSLVPDGLGSVCQALLAAHERFEVPFLASSAGTLIRLAGAAFAIYSGLSLNWIGWVWVLGSCLSAVILLSAAFGVAKSRGKTAWFDQEFWVQQLRLAVPFLVIGFLLTMEFQIDVIILSKTSTAEAVGWYSAATTLAFALNLIPQAFRMAVYPRMARYFQSEPDHLRRLYESSILFLATLAFPIVSGLVLVSGDVVNLIYGPKFQGTVLPLQILSWSLIFLFLNVPSSRLMLVSDRQANLSKLLAGSMTLNIVLNLALDPRFGPAGAATARLASTIAFFIPNLVIASRVIHPGPLLGKLIRPFLATVGMSIAVRLLQQRQPLMLVILAGFVTYTTLLFVLGGLPVHFSSGVFKEKNI